MRRILCLAILCLLATALVLSSCTQKAPEAPPTAEIETTKTATPTAPIAPTPPPPPTPPSPAALPAASDDGWGLWGPLKWPEEYKTTKGARLDFVKKEEVTVGGKPAIIYFLVAIGLFQDKVYHLWVKSLSNTTPTELIPEAKIDGSGYVIAGESRLQLGVQAPAKGEAMEFALMTVDKTAGAFGKIIPYPIESNQGFYRLWVELRSKKGDLFIIYGEGFEPNEEMSFTSTSDGEVLKGKIKADDKGRLNIIVLPAVVGKESDLATYTALGKYGEVKVSYEWGVEATKTVPLSPTPTSTLPSPPTPPPLPTKPPPTRPLPPFDAFVKGIAINDWPPLNLPTPGYELYASPTVDQSLENIAATGANWIALLVHVGQEAITSTTIFRAQSATIASTASDSALLHVINVAHSLGMRVMLTPYIMFSNNPTNQWAGLIGTAFTSESQWQDWFTSYRDLINHYATFAQEAGVDMLSVGHELGGTTHRESDWRRVIQEVRERFEGAITYSSLCSYNLSISPANLFPHGEEQRITWWDAVDYVGVDVYYELTDKNDPTVEELKAAWTQRGYIALLESLSSQSNKPIIFTEFGYFSRDGTNKSPASFKIAPTIDLQEQADCYQAALEVLWGKPWLAGMFWFAWDANLSIRPGGPNAPTMTPYGKPAEEVLKKFYLSQ